MYFFKNAFKALRSGNSNMAVLITIGTNAAYLVRASPPPPPALSPFFSDILCCVLSNATHV
jgi:hypothetical protein